MSDYYCPRCQSEYEACGLKDQDAGEHMCVDCGFKFIVIIEYEPIFDTVCVEHEFNESGRCEHCGKARE